MFYLKIDKQLIDHPLTDLLMEKELRLFIIVL